MGKPSALDDGKLKEDKWLKTRKTPFQSMGKNTQWMS